MTTTTTTPAQAFHKACVEATKADNNKWTMLGSYCLSENFHKPEVSPAIKNGKLDNSGFVATFKQDLGDVVGAETTVRAFQKYISTIFKAKLIVLASEGQKVTYEKGSSDKKVTVVVSMETLFNYEGKGKIAPKHVFDGVIKSQQTPETAIETIRRSVALIEKKMASLDTSDHMEASVLINRINQAYMAVTTAPQVAVNQ